MATEMKVKLSNLKVDNTIEGIIDKAINDKNNNDITNMYFPKSGGKLTGTHIMRNTSNGDLNFFSGTSNDGAHIRLYPTDFSTAETMRQGGMFEINATGFANGDKSQFNIYKLIGNGNGTLTWNTNDLAGSAIINKIYKERSGYIKYVSGLLIQWGAIYGSENPTHSGTLTFPITFKTKPIIATSIDGAWELGGNVYIRNSYADKFQWMSDKSFNLFWIAIGY